MWWIFETFTLLCKGLSIPYHPPLKMWIVIWLLRLVAISQEILNQICYNMYSFNLSISTMKHLPFFFHQPKTFNLIVSPKQFFFFNFYFFNFKCFILTFLVKPFLFSSPDSELRHVHVKKCTINIKKLHFSFHL
jgi:hypothetical protein